MALSKKKQKNKNFKRFTKEQITTLLFIISCVVGCVGLFMPNDDLEMVCTVISVVAAIGFVIMIFVDGDKTGGSFILEFEKEIEEARTETGYFGKQK